MLNFTSQLFITINLFLQCLAGLLHSQLGCRGLQIHVIMAPSANQWCNLPHKPFHGDLRAVHCCCRSRCVISPLSWYSLWPKATQGELSLGTAAQETWQPEGIPVPVPYCTAQGRWLAQPWPAAFPTCEWGRGASRTPERSHGGGLDTHPARGSACPHSAENLALPALGAPPQPRRGGDACD